MTAVNQDPARELVYMDKSYIRKNYQCHDDFLVDSNDKQSSEFAETTFQNVKQRLNQSFLELKSNAGCIMKANIHLHDLVQHILVFEYLVKDSYNDISEGQRFIAIEQ